MASAWSMTFFCIVPLAAASVCSWSSHCFSSLIRRCAASSIVCPTRDTLHISGPQRFPKTKHSTSKKALILHDTGLELESKYTNNILALFLGKDITIKIFAHRKVIMKYTQILGGDINRLSECSPSYPIKRVTMGSCMNVGPSLMDSRICSIYISATLW